MPGIQNTMKLKTNLNEIRHRNQQKKKKTKKGGMEKRTQKKENPRFLFICLETV